MNEPLISTAEAAVILGVDQSRIRQLLSAGMLDGEKTDNGRAWKVRPSSVERYRFNRAEIERLRAKPARAVKP